MKDFSKIIILFISIFFILSCGNNNDSIVKLDKYKGRYEGALNTTQNTR